MRGVRRGWSDSESRHIGVVGRSLKGLDAVTSEEPSFSFLFGVTHHQEDDDEDEEKKGGCGGDDENENLDGRVEKNGDRGEYSRVTRFLRFKHPS